MTAKLPAPVAAVARIFDENPWPAGGVQALCLPALAVAVSGGGDSLALLLAAEDAFPGRIHAVTVDHGLRAESADEAAYVAQLCARLGIAHQILRWQGPDPKGNLMDQARRARLDLIGAWARGAGIGHVLLGHTADDNAETFLMNLARKAGLDGLCGMRRDWHEGGIHWHRPFLALSRDELRADLRRRSVDWIDDPSNDNPRFTRVKARRTMAALAPLGITAEGITATLSYLDAAQRALMRTCADVARGMTGEAGALRMPHAAFCALDPEIQRRLIGAAIQWISGADFPPRGAQVQALLPRLAAAQEAQLGGGRFLHRQGQLYILREARGVMGPMAFDTPEGQIWDRRWRISGPARPGAEIRALGAAGYPQCPDARRFGLREALVVTPAIWQGDQLLAAPLAGLYGPADGSRDRPYQADVSQGLAEFILSH